MKSDATTNMQKVSRALLEVKAGDYVLTSDIAADTEVKASHVSAMLNNLRFRDFIESQKGSAGGNEQEHRVVEANRSKFVAWLDRDTVKPPTNDSTTKGRATNKSASAHRVDLAMMKDKPMSLSQLASAAEAGTLPPHEDDEAADAKLDLTTVLDTPAGKRRPTVEEIAAWMMSTLQLYGASIVTQYKVTGLFLEAIEDEQ